MLVEEALDIFHGAPLREVKESDGWQVQHSCYGGKINVKSRCLVQRASHDMCVETTTDMNAG